MKGKKIGIIIISVILFCITIGIVIYFKNDNNNLNDNKETNKTQKDNNNVESREEVKENEEKSLQYIEPETTITGVLPVVNDYKIINVPEGKFDEIIKSNGYEIENEYDEYDKLIILKDNNYKVEDGNDYPNNKAYYDRKNNKIYAGYAFIDRINDDTVYLGQFNPDKNYDDYFGEKIVRVDVLSELSDKIITVNLNDYFYDSNLNSQIKSTYFSESDYYIIYHSTVFDSNDGIIEGDYLLFDNKLNLIMNNFDFYKEDDNQRLIVYKNGRMNLYEPNLKPINEISIKNVISLMENYAVINDSSTIKLLKYENVINNKNELINTGIKLSKNQKFYSSNEEDNKIIITLKDYNKSEKEIKKVCNKDMEDGIFGIMFIYNLNNKKVSKENTCISDPL